MRLAKVLSVLLLLALRGFAVSVSLVNHAAFDLTLTYAVPYTQPLGFTTTPGNTLVVVMEDLNGGGTNISDDASDSFIDTPFGGWYVYNLGAATTLTLTYFPNFGTNVEVRVFVYELTPCQQYGFGGYVNGNPAAPNVGPVLTGPSYTGNFYFTFMGSEIPFPQTWSGVSPSPPWTFESLSNDWGDGVAYAFASGSQQATFGATGIYISEGEVMAPYPLPPPPPPPPPAAKQTVFVTTQLREWRP